MHVCSGERYLQQLRRSTPSTTVLCLSMRTPLPRWLSRRGLDADAVTRATNAARRTAVPIDPRLQPTGRASEAVPGSGLAFGQYRWKRLGLAVDKGPDQGGFRRPRGFRVPLLRGAYDRVSSFLVIIDWWDGGVLLILIQMSMFLSARSTNPS